jgi:hypothetical protein
MIEKGYELKTIRVILLFILGVVLSSCVGVSQMQEKLAKATEKTNSVAEMRFMPIDALTEQTVKFDEKTPFYDFQHGKSFYSAISLPEPRQPRFLNVKTYLTSSYLPSAAVLIPSFLVLDKNKKEIAKIESYRLNDGTDFWQGGYFQGRVSLPADAAYLVSYASSEHTPELKTYAENGTEYVLPLSPAGEFKLTLSEPLPLDYNFSTVVIKDSADVLDTDKANFYYVKKIEGKEVENNLLNSIKLNHGKGMRIKPYPFDRDLPLKTVTLTIAGKLQYGAPIQEIFNKIYEVEGAVRFIPIKNRKYVVKGELNDAYQAVWIEDQESHQIMDRKIEVKAQ